MNKKNTAEHVKLFKSLMEISEINEFINRLGITIVDLDKKCFLSKGLWEEISDDDISFWMEKWNSAKYFGSLENESLRGASASACRCSSVTRSVFRIQDKQSVWRSIFEKSGVLFAKEDDTPWIVVSTAEDIACIDAGQEILHDQDKDARMLITAIEVIISSLDIGDTVEQILEQAKLIVPYEQATLQVLHDGVLEIMGTKGLYEMNDYSLLKHPFPEEGSIETRSIQERRPWLSNDVDPSQLRPYVENHVIRSWLGVPLIAHGDVVGLLTFSSKEKKFFTNRHIQLAASFAGPVAIALENSRMHGETYQLAMKDALTGINSRHAFNLHGKYIFENSKREERILALAMLDLDRFKNINDDFGHLIGDKVLRKVCQICESNLRVTDFIARYGGEEIVILFPDTSADTAADIARRIGWEVSRMNIEGVDRPVTLSAGVTGDRVGRNSLMNELIQQADEALYQSKANGRNCITVFHKDSVKMLA